MSFMKMILGEGSEPEGSFVNPLDFLRNYYNYKTRAQIMNNLENNFQMQELGPLAEPKQKFWFGENSVIDSGRSPDMTKYKSYRDYWNQNFPAPNIENFDMNNMEEAEEYNRLMTKRAQKAPML